MNSRRTVTRLLNLSLPLLLAAGCATGGPRFSQPESPSRPDEALVYFYRPGKEAWNVKGRKFHLYANSQEVGTLPFGGYFHRTLAPGRTVFLADSSGSLFLSGALVYAVEEVSKKPGVVSVELAPGSVTFVKLQAKDEFWSIGGHLLIEEREAALKGLEKTKLVQ